MSPDDEQLVWSDAGEFDDGSYGLGPPDEDEPGEEAEDNALDILENDPEMAELLAISDYGRVRFESLAAVPLEWVWQDYVPSGAVSVIAGAPGSGKSSLLFLLLAARARGAGSCQICEREVRRAPDFRNIILVEAEHSAPSTARKLLGACDFIGVSRDALDRVICISRKSVLIGDMKWKLIERLISTGKISDVALDTLARVSPRGAESNDERSQTEIFDSITKALEMAPPRGIPTVWMLAHTRKQGTNKPGKDAPKLGLDDVSGSLQRTGQADAVITVEAERDDGRVVATKIVLQKSREEPDEYPAEYRLVLGDGAGAALSSADLNFARVREWFEKNPGGSARDAAKELKLGRETISAIKQELMG